MNSRGAMIIFYAETPLHAGSGVGLGAVDLPIQRERMSNLPMLQGSGIKGALRERMRPTEPDSLGARQKGRLNQDLFLAMFGPWVSGDKKPAKHAQTRQASPPEPDPDAKANQTPTPRPDEFAGALSLLDARLLLFPVRTAFGGFAWLTCPFILERLQRDMAILGHATAGLWDLAALRAGEEGALVTKNPPSAVVRDGSLIIEDMDYPATPHKEVDTLATWLADSAFPQRGEYEPFRRRIKEQLAIVSDTELTFLAKHATEVVARTRINADSGTVGQGALWTEESLPAETVLWTLAMLADSRAPNGNNRENDGNGSQQLKADTLCREFIARASELSRIQLGGDRNVGRGLATIHILPEWSHAQ